MPIAFMLRCFGDAEGGVERVGDAAVSRTLAGERAARYRLKTMSEPLRLTIVYEDAGDGDGWVVARIPQVRGAISQGRTREEARENVIDALRELLAVRFGSPPELPDPADSDSLELTLAA
jgi:predicted RNase H-like HicB family nuclease